MQRETTDANNQNVVPCSPRVIYSGEEGLCICKGSNDKKEAESS